MKIGILSPQFGRGISDRENHVWAIARGLSRSHSVRVMTRRHNTGHEGSEGSKRQPALSVRDADGSSLEVETLGESRLAEILEPTDSRLR